MKTIKNIIDFIWCIFICIWAFIKAVMSFPFAVIEVISRIAGRTLSISAINDIIHMYDDAELYNDNYNLLVILKERVEEEW